jgi:hypothetical protein
MKLALIKKTLGNNVIYKIVEITNCDCGKVNYNWLDEAQDEKEGLKKLEEQIKFQKSCKEEILKEVIC